MVLLGTKEQFKIGNECMGQLTQSYIAYLVAMLDELFQMVIYGTIFSITALAFHLAHLFGIILIVLAEYRKQGLIIPKNVFLTFSADT